MAVSTVSGFAYKNRKSLLLICIIIHLIFVLPNTDNFLVMDEIDFVQVGENIKDTGEPKYYHGEQSPETLGLWHPPLFLHLLAASFVIGGVSEVSASAVTAISSLATMILIYLTALQLFRNDEKKHLTALTASFLFALNPYSIQNAVLVDIDGSILTLFMLLFMFLFIKELNRNPEQVEKRDNKIRMQVLIVLGLVFALNLWAKLGTPAVLIIGVLFYYLFNKSVKRGIFYSFVISITGLGIFFLTWYVYAKAMGLPPDYPFTHSSSTLGTAGLRSSDASYVLYVMGGRLKTIVFWVTPFFVMLTANVFVLRVRNFIRTKRLDMPDLLLLIAFIIFVTYIIFVSIAYYFPKYFAPMMPFASIAIAYFLVQQEYWPTGRSLRHFIKEILPFYIAIMVLTAVLMYVLLGDPNLSRDELGSSVQFSGFYFGIILLNMLLVKLFLKYRSRWDVSWRHALVIGLLLGFVPAGMYINAIQATADYSVGYNYGEKGMLDTAEYLDSMTNSTDIVLAPKDIGYYAGVLYFEAFGSWMEDLDTVNETITNNNITFIVLRRDDAYGWNDLPDDITEHITTNFTEIKRDEFADFIVFQKKM